MKRILLIAAALCVASTAQAGPLGLFGCRCQSGATAPQGPIRRLVQHVQQHRPIATAAANTFHAAGQLVESKPVVTAVRNTFGTCPGGVCPK